MLDASRYVIRKPDGSLVASRLSLGMPATFDDYQAAAAYVLVLEQLSEIRGMKNA